MDRKTIKKIDLGTYLEVGMYILFLLCPVNTIFISKQLTIL